MFSRRFRSIEKGAAQTHYGTGDFENLRTSTIAGVNGKTETKKLAFTWGADTYYQRPQIQIDSSGNIYILNREKDVVGGGQNMWNFETVKISYDEFYVHDVNGQNTGVRKASPITHNSSPDPADYTYFIDYQPGDKIHKASNKPNEFFWRNYIPGHVYGIDQSTDSLLIQMSKKDDTAGAMYLLDVNIPDDGETFLFNQFWNYAGLFKQNSAKGSYNLPVVKDVLAKYEDPSKQIIALRGK